MSGYAAYPYYSILGGGPAVRLSMVDARGGEFFARVMKPKSGRAWREKRLRALEMVAAAIADGCDPGEVEEASDEGEEGR